MLPLIFKESSNFAVVHLHTFKSLGYLLLFLLIRLGCSVGVVVCLILVLLAVSMATYFPMEIIIRLREQKEKQVVLEGVVKHKSQSAKTWLPHLEPLGNKKEQHVEMVKKSEENIAEDNLVSNKWTD